MNVVKNIREIRLKKGIKQEVLADALGVDVAVISNLENGKRDLKVKELEIISNCFNEDVLYLFTYPQRYIDKDEILIDKPQSPKVTLQIDLEDNIKADVIKLAFGDRVVVINNQ